MTYKDPQPTHYALGAGQSSACGLHGMQHRSVKYTRDRDRVSCRKCRFWLEKNP